MCKSREVNQNLSYLMFERPHHQSFRVTIILKLADFGNGVMLEYTSRVNLNGCDGMLL